MNKEKVKMFRMILQMQFMQSRCDTIEAYVNETSFPEPYEYAFTAMRELKKHGFIPFDDIDEDDPNDLVGEVGKK